MRVPTLRLRKGGEAATRLARAPASLLNAIDATEHAARCLESTATITAEQATQQYQADRQRILHEAKRQHVRTLALMDAAVDRARFDIDDLLRRSAGYAYHDWDSDLWIADYEKALSMPYLVKAATLSLTSPTKVVELPFAVPALGLNLVITHEPKGLDSANNLAQAIAIRALASSLPGSLQVHLIDPGGLGQNLGILSRLPPPLAAGSVCTTLDDAVATLRVLQDHVHRLNSHVLLGEDDTLPARWRHGIADRIPCHLVVATGWGTDISQGIVNQLHTLARTGRRCGISLIIVIDHSHDRPENRLVNQLIDGAEQIHVNGNNHGVWRSAPASIHYDAKIRCPRPPGAAQHRLMLTAVAPLARRSINDDEQPGSTLGTLG